MRFPNIHQALLASMLAGVMATTGCTRPSGGAPQGRPQQRQALRVRTSPVVVQDVVHLIKALGSLEAQDMVQVTAQALGAATWNAAFALGRGGRLGALAPGFAADLVAFDLPNLASLPYRFGESFVHTVVKIGRVVVEAGRLVSA